MNYTKENIVIQTKDIIFQITTLIQQRYPNLNLSLIDLTECEKKLKKKYDILDEDSLIIFKIDMKNEDILTKFVYYEIYNPYTLETLNLSICTEKDIIINIPVNIEDETISL